MKIAFLHTSDIHISKFESLVKKYDKNIQIEHFVNSAILDFAMKTGGTDAVSFREKVNSIQNVNPDLIICTCSTYGALCDSTPGIERIDGPIASYLVDTYTTIGLAFTAESTMKVSKELLLKKAEKRNKEITVVECSCVDAWKFYESNNFEQYERSIAKQIEKNDSDLDVVFFAQASMEGALQYLNDFSKEIVTSPEFGVKTYIENLVS